MVDVCEEDTRGYVGGKVVPLFFMLSETCQNLSRSV